MDYCLTVADNNIMANDDLKSMSEDGWILRGWMSAQNGRIVFIWEKRSEG